MTVVVAGKLLETFNKCPICDRELMVKNLSITENTLDLDCTCGWGIHVLEHKVTLKFKKVDCHED